jgi:AbrB family looped-hinge helix DNA binding protein
MRTTIDRAGRVVIPKPLREQAGLKEGIELQIEFRDGRIEIEPASVPMRLTRVGPHPKIEAEAEMPTLTAAAVRTVLENTRR